MKKKHLENILFYLIPVLLFLTALISVFNNSVWWDEKFSLAMIEKSYSDITHLTALDVHPPLYYFILKSGTQILSIFSLSTTMAAKFISFVPCFILLIIGFTLIPQYWNRCSAFFFNLFVVSMPHFAEFYVEIRMYSWAVLWCILSFLCVYFILFLPNKTSFTWIILSISSLFACYTHYFAGLTCILLYILLFSFLLKFSPRQLIAFGFSSIGVSVGYVPWLKVLVTQLREIKSDFWMASTLT